MSDPTVPRQTGSVTPPPEPAGWPPADAYPSTSRPSASHPSDDPGAAATADASAGASGASGNAQTAKEQAGEVKDTAAGAARDVAGTAKEQAGNVFGEVGQQSRHLLSQTTSELTSQASSQQSRIAGGISDYAGQLRSMASNAEQSGVVTDLVHQVADRGERAAAYLSDREPRDLLDDVKSFARRRPVAFLGIAAGAGILVGRLSRGLFAEARGGDPMVSSGGQNHEQARRSASLEEIPTSGTGAGPTDDSPLTDPSGGAAGGMLDPALGAADAPPQPVYGNVTNTGAVTSGAPAFGDHVDRDLDR